MKAKLYKALSIILACIIVFSVCVCAAPSVFATDDAVYYVSATGDDANAGTTDTAPLLTVNGAVKKANAANYGAGDIVTVKVMGTDAVSWGIENQRIADHSFKLFITSAAADGSALVGEGSVSPNFGGDVEFDNIKVNFSNKYAQICGTGHNVTFNANCKYNGNVDMAHYTVGAYSSGIEGTYNDDITFINNIGIKKINVLNNYSGTVLNGRLHIIYNYATLKPKFYLSTYDNYISINNAINIEIKASQGADFVKYSGGSNPSFGENGYLQILNSGSSDIVSTGTVLDSVPDDKLWVINNKIGAADLLTITETKGEFKVNTEIYSDVTASSFTDPNIVITEKDGYLTLPAGEYNVTAKKIPQYTTYYVSASGSDENDGKTENTAVTTVQKAIELANGLGFISTDNVTVKLLGDEVNMGNMPAYPYTLVIEGSKLSEGVTRLNINSNKTVGNCTTDAFTTYKTVELYLAGQWLRYEATDTNIVFESDSKFTGTYHHLVYGTNTDGGSSKIFSEPQTIVMKTAAPQDGIGFVNFGWGGRTYNANINLVLDHPSGFKVRFNTYASSKPQGNVKYNANVNLYLNNLINLSFIAFEQATFNEGINIFNNCDFILYSGLSGFDSLPENTWILNNNTDVKVPIIATNKAGQYTTELNWEKVKITAANADGDTFEMQNGILDLEEPGTYEIYLECKGEHKFGEYVDDNNAYCEKNATQTAYCEYCNKADSRELEGTALMHIYSSETDKICDRCSQVREIEGNYLVKDSISGEWTLYEDGTISFGSALAQCEGKWLYVENGKLSDKTLLVKDGEEWFYVVDGEWDETFTDIIEYQGKNIYIKDGKWDETYTAFVEYLSETLYIENGVWNETTRFVKYQNKYLYIQNGKWDNSYTALVKNSDKWFYVVNGEWASKTVVIEYNNESIYIKGGVWRTDVTGLVKYSNEWLYIKEGKWKAGFTGFLKYQGKSIYVKAGKWNSTTKLIKHNNNWRYVKNGLWQNTTTAIVKLSGKQYYIKNGLWKKATTAVVKVSGKQYYIKKGLWQNTKTGIVKISGKQYFIKKGIWNSTLQTLYKKNNKYYAIKNGKWYKSKAVIYYSGSWFYANKGYAQLKFTGKVKIGSKTYTVKAGKVTAPKLAKPKTKAATSAVAQKQTKWTPTAISTKNYTPSVPAPIIWTPTYEEQTNTEIPRILCWGDSITYGMGMDADKKYPSVLQQLIGDGYNVYNGGASGEKSYTIAARQGAYEVYLDKEIVFEEGVTRVSLGEPNNHSMEFADGTKLGISRWGDPFNSELTISKVYINGQEYKFGDAGVGSFYLERTDATTALTLAKGSLVEFESQRMQQGSFVEIFYVGANDGISSTKENIDYIINRYKDMIKRHGNDNYIVIVPQWDTGFSEAFKEEFGDKAVDIRKEMCSRDLSTVGLVPTEDDLALQRRGVIPTALKYNNDPTDSLHLNEYGYKMMANIIYERGVGLGYWK